MNSKKKKTFSHERDIMPNGAEAATANNTYEFPIREVPRRLEAVGRPPWYVRFGNRIGVTMADVQSQKGWKWDPQNIGPIVTILTFFLMLAGGIAAAAWYLGVEYQKGNDLERRLQKQEASAASAEKLGTYKAGAVDGQRGHVNTNTNTQEGH